VDYSGKRIGIVDPATGEIHEAEIFRRRARRLEPHLCGATWTQQLRTGPARTCEMFRFFGGVPKLLVPTI